jgi:hypothetical protein
MLVRQFENMTNTCRAFVLVAFRLVAPAQFIDKMLQMRRHGRRVQTKDLLEMLAHGIADRSASPVIERFDVGCIWTFHDRFRALTIVVGSGDDIPSHRTRICFHEAVDSGSCWQIFDEGEGFPREQSEAPTTEIWTPECWLCGRAQ